jgi:hypothetical protein
VEGFNAFSHDDIYSAFSKIRVMRRKTVECLQQLCYNILMAEWGNDSFTMETDTICRDKFIGFSTMEPLRATLLSLME